MRAFLSANGTYLFDGLQIEQKTYDSSWILGSSTRSAEGLTILTSGVLYPSQGTIEEWVYIDPNGVRASTPPMLRLTRYRLEDGLHQLIGK